MGAAVIEAPSDRFAFGANWARFLAVLTEDRIERAENSLKEMLETSTLNGKTFLDIGSGSGLFSLAARRMGAHVRSFDYDSQSVGCTRALRERFCPGDADWQVEQGSILDEVYLNSLGQYDIVYSWGVLHHTGAMWPAITNASRTVRRGGRLFIAIYNDQGWVSSAWKIVKRTYNRLPRPLRFLLTWPSFALIKGPALVRDTLKGSPLKSWRNSFQTRGMSPWTDLVDWVGGYPFEVARREQVVDFLTARSFVLRKLKSCGRKLGCNEFVFELKP
jgi:SAM-dependent methyltransferase